EGVRQLIESLRDQLGIAFVMVTHDMHMARSLGRVLRLEQGRLLVEHAAES
ncbi:MAG: lipoprotein-releasing system ATP-binding protein LolD, partial [Marinobacter sp.]|nr:lipoprotein-releasing system ATP-binding protein LolD [Marinobacter sp.]